MVQERILLGAVEAMDFVNKEDSACSVLTGFFRVRHDLLDFFDPRKHGGKLNEFSLGCMRNDLRQRRHAQSANAMAFREQGYVPGLQIHPASADACDLPAGARPCFRGPEWPGINSWVR